MNDSDIEPEEGDLFIDDDNNIVVFREFLADYCRYTDLKTYKTDQLPIEDWEVNFTYIGVSNYYTVTNALKIKERLSVSLVLADPTYTNNSIKDRPSLDQVVYKVLKTAAPWVAKIRKALEPKEDPIDEG
jgi:hypothetical protein